MVGDDRRLATGSGKDVLWWAVHFLAFGLDLSGM